MISNIRFQTIWLVFFVLMLWSCKHETQWQGQGSVKKVSTKTVPVQLQRKATYDLGNGIFCSNEFEGARLNGVALTDDTLITVLITPENTPINGSPWYAFKLWSEKKQDVTINLTYLNGVSHRYYPKFSHNGKSWSNLDSAKYEVVYKSAKERKKSPVAAKLKVTVSPDTLWLSAQELTTSFEVDQWLDQLAARSFASKVKVGESREGRAINGLKISEGNSGKYIVLLSRQHPPEVTGYLAMQAFVEKLSSGEKLASDFRKTYTILAIPLANPDGVAQGHWRHNRGGVDLNRDWLDFNQPETSAIRNFVKHQVDSVNGEVAFFMDFHSTFYDIYYVNGEDAAAGSKGIVRQMIEQTGAEFPNYTPNIKSLKNESGITSDNYFYNTYHAPSLTYEIGDNTPRDFVRKKAEITAEKLMQLMLE